jgi:hypothetical protein
MAEMVLPGVYIEVRPEGLIVPGRVTVGNLGIVGTASKGPIGKPVVLGSYAEARQLFGSYDPWIDGKSNELTLVRALELAYAHGATTVVAVRVAGNDAKASSYKLKSESGEAVTLSAKTEGSWGDSLSVSVIKSEQDAFVEGETVANLKLSRAPVVQSSRNRILINGKSRKLVYDGDPTAGQIKVGNDGTLTFPTGEQPIPPDAADPSKKSDVVMASYTVSKDEAVQVKIRLGRAEEVYTVVDCKDLVRDINDPDQGSAWVKAELIDESKGNEKPTESDKDAFAPLLEGDNGAVGAVYETGLEMLLDQDVQIIVAAGQDDSFGDELDAHCQNASTDAIKRDRIGVIGTGDLGNDTSASLSKVTDHTLASDRVILVAPGIKVTDTAATPPVEVTLPGSYAAAAVAGLLASLPPHFSPTNKTLRVGGLEHRYNDAALGQLVKSRVLALESRQGIRIVRGITTSTNTAWTQITTRRIVDYAKYGVRSAANSYIGLLNNDRVRGALRATINSFLADMVTAEMLVSYELSVTATRDQERKGIVQVTMTLRPTFSIDFIQVTMFLE